MPSHYLNQSWDIVNWNLRHKRQWSRKQNLYIFIQENAIRNGVWKITAILPRPRCVNISHNDSESYSLYFFVPIDSASYHKNLQGIELVEFDNHLVIELCNLAGVALFDVIYKPLDFRNVTLSVKTGVAAA